LDHFRYPLHFLLLACFVLLMVAMARLHLADDLYAAFALYGAMHASALIIALRAHQPLWRKCLFIVTAAALSAAAVGVGIATEQLLGTRRGDSALYAALGFSAVTGAAAYGLLIRLCGFYELTARAIVVICCSCMLATYAAFVTLAHVHSLGRWWLAVLWWYAFSGSLWYFDRRHQGLSGERTCSGRTPIPRI
jgi:hypothetical protein